MPAVAWTAFSFVDPHHLNYTLNPTPIARRGMTVKKNGRTTQATVGTITDINVNISVGGYSCGAAQFRNQIGIRGIGGNPFSRWWGLWFTDRDGKQQSTRSPSSLCRTHRQQPHLC
jgi:hypothetical protein